MSWSLMKPLHQTCCDWKIKSKSFIYIKEGYYVTTVFNGYRCRNRQCPRRNLLSGRRADRLCTARMGTQRRSTLSWKYGFWLGAQLGSCKRMCTGCFKRDQYCSRTDRCRIHHLHARGYRPLWQRRQWDLGLCQCRCTKRWWSRSSDSYVSGSGGRDLSEKWADLCTWCTSPSSLGKRQDAWSIWENCRNRHV